LLTVWAAEGHAIVLAVGPHDGSASDIYNLITTALGIAPSADERTKPPCCDEAGWAPVDEAASEELAAAIDRLARVRRQRRG